jgi:hypothetical protein
MPLHSKLVSVPREIHGKLQPDIVNWREILIHTVMTEITEHKNYHYANLHVVECETVSLYTVYVPKLHFHDRLIFLDSFLEDTFKGTHIILTETGIEYMFIRCSQNLSQLNLVSLIKSAHFKRRHQPT